jgi:hypothetical protein
MPPHTPPHPTPPHPTPPKKPIVALTSTQPHTRTQVLFVGALLLPDTPNSLMQRGRAAEARLVLRRLRGTAAVDAELDDIRAAVGVARQSRGGLRTLFSRR